MAKIEHTNRLINEKSPYLLQHAHNPIDWYPWGEEAFARAKAEDKPVFLSVGYSTCHWCHVMEMECFEDKELAQIMNSSFVAIKVDKEERPDIDRVYMGVCQALTGQGGWPLTIIMDPDKHPFFAGTYFPKQSTSKQPGLMQILMTVREKWTTNRDELLLYGQQVVKTLQSELRTFEPSELKPSWVDEAFAQFHKDFDKDFGGFGMAPKFPAPYNLAFLLYYWKKTGNEQALSMVEKTLSAMRNGGIYDHLGYGFSRYSVDRKWLVPHFEKMLYDNAMIGCIYLEAYQCTGKSDYSQVAEEIIAYVLRVLDDPEGGFYSAEDADSEGREGQFYVWSLEEILQCLGEEQGKVFADFYGVTEKGNFEQNANILNMIQHDLAEYPSGRNMTVEDLTQLLRAGRETLFKQREKRIHPFKDDKILTAWNALMIVALAKAARVMNQPEYAHRAKRCLDFIYAKLFRQDGRLMARYRDGSTDYPAYLDDYAYLLWALIEMYEATFAAEYLIKAQHLTQEMLRLFADEKQGGFFFSGTDNEMLITRPKELYDSCIPSGNSVALLAIVRLGRYTDDHELLKTAEKMLQAFAGEVDKFPRFYPGFLLALEQYQAPLSQIIIVGQKNDDVVQAMIAAVGRCYLPTTVMIINDPSDSRTVETVLPRISEYKSVNGRPAAYICENYTCQAPYSNVADFIKAIEKIQEKR